MIIDANGYNIIIEKGSLRKAGDYLGNINKAMIVTDSGVPEKYAKTVLDFCPEGSFIKTIPQGEKSKCFDMLQDLIEEMLEHGFNRHDCVIAVGGGVTGDLSGFAASIYMRGIDFFNIPTTVLAQVDSSVGGKTAIDFKSYKNIAGSFYRPKKVIVDEDTLSTLPPRQISNGLAEAVKMSLTSDRELFELFEAGNPFESIGKIIEKSLLIKADVVNKDEKESGLRKVLNFGHTIGHGIEANCGSELYHGECVAIGMLPMCSEPVRHRLTAVLENLNLPTHCNISHDKIYEALLHDKKSDGDTITAVYVDEPGAFRFISMTPGELKEKLYTITEN